MKQVYIGSDYFTKQAKLMASVCAHGHDEMYFVVKFAKLFNLHHQVEGL